MSIFPGPLKSKQALVLESIGNHMWKLLIVDDEDIIREGMRDLVDWVSESVQIVGEARNGVEAVEKVKILQPDIIIVDVVMPEMNGLEFTKIIRNYDSDKIFIYLSAHDKFEYVQQALKNQASDYLLKPVHIPDLLKVIRKQVSILEKRKRQIENVLNLEKTVLYNRKYLIEKFYYNLFTGNIESVVIAQEQIKALDINYDVHSTVLPFYIYRYSSVSFSEIQNIVLSLESKAVAIEITTGLIYGFLPDYNIAFEETIVKKTSGFDFVLSKQKYTLENISLFFLTIEDNKKYLNPIVDRICRIAQSRYIESIGMPEIAEELGFSSNYLEKVFKKEKDTTFVEYLTAIRIEKAKNLLKDVNYRIYEVSNAVGYKDSNYFCRIFKRKIGLSPGEYRNNYYGR